MGFLNRVRASYHIGKAQAKEQRRINEADDWNTAATNPNKVAAFAGRVSEHHVTKGAATFGKAAVKATENAAVKGVNWVMTGNTEGKRRTSAPSTTTPRRKRTSSTGTTTRVVYVAANPPKPKRRKPKKDYWDNPPF
jgi:hypothetical protein